MSAIFVVDENQRKIAEKLIEKLEKDGLKIATKIIDEKIRELKNFGKLKNITKNIMKIMVKSLAVVNSDKKYQIFIYF